MTRIARLTAGALGRTAAVYTRLLSPQAAIAVFLAIYILSAVVFQSRSDIPLWQDGSPADVMNGTLIWMISAISFLMAAGTRHDPVRSLMWFAGSAALGVVALDEMFSIHEYASMIRDDDDPKLLMAVGAGVALYVLVRVQKVGGLALKLLILGFAFHCAYLLSDLGDGDFFDIRFLGEDRLRTIEEVLEYAAMSTYFAAFMLIAIAEFGRSFQARR